MIVKIKKKSKTSKETPLRRAVKSLSDTLRRKGEFFNKKSDEQ